MRRRSAVVLSFAMLLSIAAGARNDNAVATIRAADKGWMKVFSAKDLDKSVAYCAEDGSVLGPNAPIATGHKAIAASFSGFFMLPELKITWQADKAEVARSGEVGFTSGTYQMTFKDPSGASVPDRGKYVTIWKKQSDGSWKVYLDIFNTDLPMPAPK